MNIVKYRFYAALAACVLVAGIASPAVGQDADKRSERREKADRDRPTDTPYSNRSVRREREAVREERAIERDRDPGYYRFRDRRRPEGDD